MHQFNDTPTLKTFKLAVRSRRLSPLD